MAGNPQIVIAVNGPGEVSGWLYPLGTALKRRLPESELYVAVVPCAFSAGTEHDVIASLPFVDAAWGVADTSALLLRNRLPKGFRPNGGGIVIHLGGETALSALLAHRLRMPCIAYAESPFLLRPLFNAVYYSGLVSSAARGGAAPAEIIGDLMVDAARMRCPVRAPRRSGRLTVGLYPGSRTYVAKYILPFYGRVANSVSEIVPDVDWILAKADYLPLQFLRHLPDIDDGRPLDADRLTFEDSNGRPALVTTAGVRIGIQTPAEVAAKANLALTTPGSNTAEMAALGIPMVVTLPTYWGETSSLPGLAGHLGRVPLVGRLMKRAAAHLYLQNLGFTSHPNRRTGRAVVPEIVGKIGAREVADKVIAILGCDTSPVEDELRSIMGPPGAADRLIDGIVHVLEGRA